MNKPPSPYPDMPQPEQPGQTQQSLQMAYDYPGQSASASEAETLYGYPHAAGFPQPGYPPTQAMNALEPVKYSSSPAMQQPGYPQIQPTQGFAHNTMRHTLWIAATALVLLLLLAGGGLYYYIQLRSTPEKTLQTYCTAIKDNDGKALYQTYSSEAQSQISVEHIQQGLSLLQDFTGGVEDCGVNADSLREDDPHASGDVTFTLMNGHLSMARLHLIDENGQWKITDTAIIP